MPAAEKPAWRKLFDGVEKRITPPLTSVTSSSDVHLVMQKLGAAKRTVSAPLGGAASRGLHLVGLPSRGDVRDLRRQLSEVERDLLSLRRELASRSEPDEQDAE